MDLPTWLCLKTVYLSGMLCICTYFSELRVNVYKVTQGFDWEGIGLERIDSFTTWSLTIQEQGTAALIYVSLDFSAIF